MRTIPTLLVCTLAALAACTEDVAGSEGDGATAGVSIIASGLSGCDGSASSSIPADGDYYLTSFGGDGDHQSMSCGGYADGVGWYAASRQRYGCGSHIAISANGKCVVVETQDYGPDVCVEHAAGRPIIDASPQVAETLFGTDSAGWSDHFAITVVEVATSTPLGPCGAGVGSGSGSGSGAGSGSGSGSGSDASPPPAASCSSATLDRDVDDGTCVQSASDETWYICSDGEWIGTSSSNSACTESYGWCESATLGEAVAPRTCVQAASDGNWYQCNGQGWVSPVDADAGTGPIGDCSAMDSL